MSIIKTHVYYLNAYYTAPLLEYGIKDQVKDILPSFGLALTMVLPVYSICFMPMNPCLLLPLQIVVGIVITVAIFEVTKLHVYLEIKGIVMPIMNKVIKRKKIFYG